jgi:hypothetical protein
MVRPPENAWPHQKAEIVVRRGGFVCQDPGVAGGGGFVGQDVRGGLRRGPLGREVPSLGGVGPWHWGLGAGAGRVKGAGRLPTR